MTAHVAFIVGRRSGMIGLAPAVALDRGGVATPAPAQLPRHQQVARPRGLGGAIDRVGAPVERQLGASWRALVDAPPCRSGPGATAPRALHLNRRGVGQPSAPKPGSRSPAPAPWCRGVPRAPTGPGCVERLSRSAEVTRISSSARSEAPAAGSAAVPPRQGRARVPGWKEVLNCASGGGGSERGVERPRYASAGLSALQGEQRRRAARPASREPGASVASHLRLPHSNTKPEAP